ncbi:17-beta-hydroxysteroid dehydrogenase 14 isoform X1 [Notechis scutatus]|uniref:17-beta-hydroxysteroid dehydrogenase 14 isoform X1 n=1 Tax=Notechis scutatus TaxID=8663 RepID=A0A6J1UQJ4_9SAUR|nr:17-beta-hydroxysteroid dehydrogenase 14 isoform X1 [Notechis scutatus]
MASGQRYPGKVVIVTGGTSGIGEGIVREFVYHGAKVVFCAPASEEEKGKGLERKLAEGGGSGEGCFVVCDVLCEADMKRLVSMTIEQHGQLDCLVNNAGGHPPDQRIDDVSAQEFRNLMDLNIVSCFLMAKFALPYLRKTKGNIINVASIVAHFGQKLAVPYVATKGAVVAMTKAMAIDESQYGVRVNSLWDGWGLQQSVQKLPSTSLQTPRFAQGPTSSSVAELNLAMGGRATKTPILVLTASKSLPRGDNFRKLQIHIGKSTRAALSACFVKLKRNSSIAALICGSKKYCIRKSSGTS